MLARLHTKRFKLLSIVVFGLLLIIIGWGSVLALTKGPKMELSYEQKVYQPGDILSLRLAIVGFDDQSDATENLAAAARLVYPPQVMKLQTFNDVDSAVSQWVYEETYNESGYLSLEGFVDKAKSQSQVATLDFVITANQPFEFSYVSTLINPNQWPRYRVYESSGIERISVAGAAADNRNIALPKQAYLDADIIHNTADREFISYSQMTASQSDHQLEAERFDVGGGTSSRQDIWRAAGIAPWTWWLLIIIFIILSVILAWQVFDIKKYRKEQRFNQLHKS